MKMILAIGGFAFGVSLLQPGCATTGGSKQVKADATLLVSGIT